jgi:hypothetical protein
VNLSGFERQYLSQKLSYCQYICEERERRKVKVVVLHAKQEQMRGGGIAPGDRRGLVVRVSALPLYP